jgi:hypothetical protein
LEERSGAHRVTQRMLEDQPPPADPVGPGVPIQPAHLGIEPEKTPSEPSPPRGQSDTELRKRQRAWRFERARFEASKVTPPTADES